MALTLSHVSSTHSGPNEMKILKGFVWYKESMALPPHAEILVTLADVSLMDVPAKVLSSKRFLAAGSPPYSFTLEYDPRMLNNRYRYAIQARIEWDRQLQFINKTFIDAFAGPPEEPVEVLVSRVARGSWHDN